jgi:hypothetical protein
MKSLNFSKKALFSCRWALVFLFLYPLESQAMSEGMLGYQIEEYSPHAHEILDDHGESALYKVSIKDVSDFLPWTESIKRASTRILDKRYFPLRPILKVVRTGIYQQKPNFRYANAKDFFSSFHEDVPHTYVVLKNKLVFAESTNFPSKERYRDKYSKHYLISGLKNHVHYAGEFRVFRDSQHKNVAVIFDNASGTFRPASEHLVNLKNLLEHNFSQPGLYFAVRSFDEIIDPQDLFGPAPRREKTL